MHDYRCDQSEADTILLSVYEILHRSGHSGPVPIDTAATDACVAAVVFSLQFHGMLSIKSLMPTGISTARLSHPLNVLISTKHVVSMLLVDEDDGHLIHRWCIVAVFIFSGWSMSALIVTVWSVR